MASSVEQSTFSEATKKVFVELEALRTELGLTCKVIENVGTFQYVITVTSPAVNDAFVKFQLTGDYPRDLPCVSVRSENSDAVRNALNDLAGDLRGRPMLVELAKTAFKDYKLSSAMSKSSAQGQVVFKPKSKKSKKKSKDKDVEESPKKTSMKTADDVVKRICWDAEVPKEDVVIGYLDRFKGLMEKSFDVFSWEDIASVDYYTFVIPRHRIQYFKYRRAIVWDKRSRLDNVFGSTGSGKTLYDVIREYRDEDYEAEPQEAPEPLSYSDSDSDDGVEVTFDREALDRQTSVAYSDDEEDEDAEESRRGVVPLSSGKEYWRDLCRPNFFICVRITDPDIQRAAAAVQDDIVAEEPLLESCCVPSNMLHCTLLTLRLNSAEEIADCGRVLQEAAGELQTSLPRSPLWVYGTSCFHERVLYAKVHHGNDFSTFLDHLRTVVRAAGVPIMDQHEFVAHVTLLKTSRPVSRQIGSREIPRYLYAGTESVDFGEQHIDTIYLCSMEKARGPDGFYISPECVSFVRPVALVKT